MNEYDKRQYRLMIETVEVNKLDINSLGKIIISLEALLGQLKEPDQEWVKTFQRVWGKLEDIYSFNIVEEKTFLSQQEIEWITQALKELRTLIQMKLN